MTLSNKDKIIIDEKYSTTLEEYIRDLIKEEKLKKQPDKIKVCKWLYADWCHHPEPYEQEKCGFYFDNENCTMFELKKEK